MPKHDKISLSVIRRLPRYYRFLGDLSKAGISRISSKELSKRMGLTASQIRQDLNCFGGFGQQGYGYNVSQLREKIGSILGLSECYPAILVGAGNMGHAIALNLDFENRGYHLVGIFDKSPAIIGTSIRGIEVLNVSELDDFCNFYKPKIAVLTLPRKTAPEIVDQLVKDGIIGFWNFSHYDFSLKYPGLAIENVHLGDSLMTLCYLTKSACEKKKKIQMKENR